MTSTKSYTKTVLTPLLKEVFNSNNHVINISSTVTRYPMVHCIKVFKYIDLFSYRIVIVLCDLIY